ncbi:ABC transporter substrate-binding protein [Pseudomonas sp. CDFA 602]|uniref:ABC transporter substrate-binding protein n=1 Tax=Pseudomonas californiensis TaxID=2829823 RepID=UPI001E54108A|nr:ABC transporter substrate-binding protein [Pseudomonas californiensis]MCD5994473.1 ABC transporter substrate-binding protein [Pseudomonas californiensis]MCD6000165.1 ABC transporter substrate-binding protein [Pseudomonas californiensis]
MKVSARWLIALACSWASSSWAASVVFISPGTENDVYWQSYVHVMQAAANTTGMSLTVLHSDRDTRKLLSMARDTLQGYARPDYLVFSNELNVAPEILRLSQGSGVKLFAVNNTLTADQIRILGDLPARYPDFIGSLVGNDEEGGYVTAKRLIALAPSVPEGDVVELLAFSGTNSTPVSLQREHGMQRAVAEHPQVHLRQIVLGGWRRDRALEQARVLLKRYPGIRLVWSANEQMAFGAMDALRERGGEPGKDIFFSAINGTALSLRAQLNGSLGVVATGHFTLGGWAMILLSRYDTAHPQARKQVGARTIDVLHVVELKDAQRFLEATRDERYRLDRQAFNVSGVGEDSPFSLKNMLPLAQPEGKKSGGER